MICPNCKAEIADNSTFCTECGVQQHPEQIASVQEEKSYKEKRIYAIKLIICIILGVTAIFYSINYAMDISNTKSYLHGNWYNDGDDDTSIVCILEFDDDTITYKCETGYYILDQTFRTWSYKVSGKDTILIKRYGNEWEKYTIERFSGGMELSPSLTDLNPERWYSTSEKWLDLTLNKKYSLYW